MFRGAMRLPTVIICATFLGTAFVFGRNQESSSCPTSRDVKVIAEVDKEIEEFRMTREEDLKEVEVSIPQNYLEEKEMLNPIWQVTVELCEEGEVGQNGTCEAFDKESNGTLLNVLIRQGQDAVNFQLPRSHAAKRDKVVDFDSALTRNVKICPAQKISPTSTLMINLVSTSLLPILVKIRTTLVEGGRGWTTKPRSNQDDEKIKEIRSEFWFSNPLIQIVRVDDILSERDDYVNLRVESEENSPCFCSLLSVQKAQCPYFDTIADAKRYGRWQTMDESTSMVIDVTELTGAREELLIVLIGADDKVCNFVNKEERDEKCGQRKTIDGGLRKNVTITLEPTARTEDRMKATFIVTVGYLVAMITCFVVSGVLFNLNEEKFDAIKKKHNEAFSKGIAKVASQTCVFTKEPEIGNEEKVKKGGMEESETKEPEIGNEEEEQVEEGIARESESDVEEGLKRRETLQRVDTRATRHADEKKSKARYQKNQLYMSGLFIISMFYAVTVMQTAFSAQRMQLTTGDNDICYYNSRCQIPLLYTSYFLDFNHFFSNLGYGIFGLTFIGIVYMQAKKYQEAGSNVKELLSNHGIPFLTGVYYSMGGALVMEGFMSAAYHICPTRISFQYDTTFMYLIAILIYVKLYQNRHPDSSASSVKAYIVLGVAIMLEAISIYFGNSSWFWGIFCLSYILSIVCVVTNIYQLERKDKLDQQPKSIMDRVMFFKVSRLLFNESRKAITGKRKGKKTRPLLVFIAVTCVINVAMCIFFGVQASLKDVTASNFILYLFMMNMFIYLGYYIVMKIHNNESLHWKTICYAGGLYWVSLNLKKNKFFPFLAVCGTICSVPAFYFFVMKEKNSNVSPAESRELNRPCQLFKFYDG